MLDSDSIKYKNLREQTRLRLKKKIERINARNKWRMEHWHNYLDDESLFYQRFEEEDFTALFKRDVEIETFYSLKNNTPVESLHRAPLVRVVAMPSGGRDC